jgi:hypothetical protein
MTKKNDVELLISICDTIAGASTLSLKEAARRNGISVPTLWAWMKDPAVVIPEYLGEQNIPFSKAMKLARKCAVAVAISEGLENRVLAGHWETVWFQGQPTWVEDERCVGIDDPDVREMLGYARDGLLRDENGNRVQHRRHVAPPAQLIEKFVEANAPKLYGQKSKLAVDSKVSLGVTVIGGQRAAPLPQPVQVVTQQITETVAREVLPEALEQFEAEPEPEPEYNAEPEAQGIDEPEPEPIAPVEGLTDDELSLLRRARSASPLGQDLARRAAEKARQNAAQRSADNIGPGRIPGSGGVRTA